MDGQPVPWINVRDPPRLVQRLPCCAAYVSFAVSSPNPSCCSKGSALGNVLDMVTDRTGTAGFLMILSHFYPKHLGLWGILLTLDVLSHWFQVQPQP